MKHIVNLLSYKVSGPPRGGQKGSLSGGPGFRIIRLRMQNSSAQTTACGRHDVFFFISGQNSNILRTLWPYFAHHYMLSRNLNICGGYDPFFAHHLILGRSSNICGRYDLFFAHHVILGHHWPKGPNEIIAPRLEISLGAPARYHCVIINRQNYDSDHEHSVANGSRSPRCFFGAVLPWR